MVTPTGFRVSTLTGSGDQFEESEPVKTQVKEEPFLKVKEEPDLGTDSNVFMEENKGIKVKEEPDLGIDSYVLMEENKGIKVKEEPGLGFESKVPVEEEMASHCKEGTIAKNEDSKSRMSFDEFLQSTNTKVQSLDDALNTYIKQEAVDSVSVAQVKASENVELKSDNQRPPLEKKELDFECPTPKGLRNPADLKKEAFEERRVNGVLVRWRVP